VRISRKLQQGTLQPLLLHRAPLYTQILATTSQGPIGVAFFGPHVTEERYACRGFAGSDENSFIASIEKHSTIQGRRADETKIDSR
jgi:hypothetical protein